MAKKRSKKTAVSAQRQAARIHQPETIGKPGHHGPTASEQRAAAKRVEQNRKGWKSHLEKRQDAIKKGEPIPEPLAPEKQVSHG